MNFKETSSKYLAAKGKLPGELHEIYKQMVDDYAFYALQCYGRNWVAYEVIAELVRAGWRPSTEVLEKNNV